MQLSVAMRDCVDYRVEGVAHESYCLQCRKRGQWVVSVDAGMGVEQRRLLADALRRCLERGAGLLDMDREGLDSVEISCSGAIAEIRLVCPKCKAVYLATDPAAVGGWCSGCHKGRLVAD